MFVRYADDFVIMNRDLYVIQECKGIISKFLAERGLELSVAKTKIVDTIIPFENNEPGFEFLSFKIKHFDTKRRSAKNRQSHNIGFRLLIFPSKDSQKKHFARINRVLRQHKTANLSDIVKKLNLIINGWTNYFRFSHFLTTKIGGYMKQILFNKLKLKYWGKRKLNSRTLRPAYDKF
jgi:RNA-directed DNA polymerase